MTDFRHMNVRIAKNNLVHPLVRDMFSVLWSSKCEVQSVLDLKDTFHSLRLQSRKYCEAIMDDLLLFSPLKKSYMGKLEDLLRALLKNGLKISQTKYQLFRTNLHYMGNEIFIQNKRVCVQPLRSRLEAIQKLQPHTMVRGCRSFAGMVNFLNLFCPELQKLLKPIYDLTRKGRPFIFGEKNYKILLMRSNAD